MKIKRLGQRVPTLYLSVQNKVAKVYGAVISSGTQNFFSLTAIMSHGDKKHFNCFSNTIKYLPKGWLAILADPIVDTSPGRACESGDRRVNSGTVNSG
ncbi:unnamed protein product [Allacma fusca]|uniref:Uncharacterized protein n=1 Tax=Allacma fusca TaxID=39272 RepID=A0A8J2NVF9_9HEXA|nr:unnamed protein product [Allacma fusca]